MTFKEKYEQSRTWYDKCLVMEIFHLAMTCREETWTLSDTAREFEVSIGLVSENLKLAHAIHENYKITECSSRQEALKRRNR